MSKQTTLVTKRVTKPRPLSNVGPITRGSMDWIVGGRSGDKASDANTGLYIRHLASWLSRRSAGWLMARTWTRRSSDSKSRVFPPSTSFCETTLIVLEVD
ncbi:hypothetical protein BJ170DRAFT_623702 [Xylariales sp. AK1849]|nr:hypothetical protein BJ170DRAFT_623702 [Xylariales sp. AK1849]